MSPEMSTASTAWLADRLDDLGDDVALGLMQVDPVQAPTEVPVGGVQETHTSTLPTAADRTREASVPRFGTESTTQ